MIWILKFRFGMIVIVKITSCVFWIWNFWVVKFLLVVYFLSLSLPFFICFFWQFYCWNVFSTENSSPTSIPHHPSAMVKKTRICFWVSRTLSRTSIGVALRIWKFCLIWIMVLHSQRGGPLLLKEWYVVLFCLWSFFVWSQEDELCLEFDSDRWSKEDKINRISLKVDFRTCHAPRTGNESSRVELIWARLNKNWFNSKLRSSLTQTLFFFFQLEFSPFKVHEHLGLTWYV